MDGDAPLRSVTLGRRNTVKHNGTISWIPKDSWAKIALFTSFAQFIITGGLELYIAITHYDFVEGVAVVGSGDVLTTGQPTFVTKLMQNNGMAIFAYHILFMFAQLFQFILIADALMQLSLIQLVTTTVFNWAMWIYSLIQLQQASSWIPSPLSQSVPGFHPTETAEMILIFVLAVFCIGWLYLTWKLYYVFGWTTYKEMGADVEVRNILYLYHIYILLLKVDVFFFLGFSVQFAWLVLNLNGQDIGAGDGLSRFQIHLLISIPGTMIMLLFAYFAIRRENKILVYLALMAFLAGAVYLCTKLYDIWGKKEERFDSSKNSLTLFIVMTLIMIFLTMTVAVLNMRKFGEGLMARLDAGSNGPETYAFQTSPRTTVSRR